MSDTKSDISSIESTHTQHSEFLNVIQHQDPQQETGKLSRYSTNNTNGHGHGNLLTRTSTIISNIKEDNKFAKTQVEPNPSFDPNDLVKTGTAIDNGLEINNKSENSLLQKRKQKKTKGRFAALENIFSNENRPSNNNTANTTSNNDGDFLPDLENVIATHESKDSDASKDSYESSEKTPVVQDTGEYNIYDITNKPPDKGFWAWTAAVCVLCINTFSWGLNACFGVYLNYYTTMNYFPGATMEQYVMIGGLGLGLSFMTCTIANGLCRRIHYKIIMTIGTAITFLSYWLASISKTVIQLIMFQGLLMSIGWGLTAGSTFVILPTWFLKKRSIAQGIATAGGGLGGIVFSRPVDQIIKSYLDNPKYKDNQTEALKMGLTWALRMEALVCGFMLVLSILLIKTYRPLKDDSENKKPFLKEIFAFVTRIDLVTNVPMLCLISWNMVYGFSYTILLFSLSSYANTIGLSYKQGSNVTTVQSVAQAVGRPLLGLCSDKIGRVNTTVIATILVTLFVFLYWIFVTTYSELLGFAFVIGFLLGVNWVNFGPMTADVVGGGGVDLNHAISIQMFTGGLPLLVAELVGLKLKRPELSRPFIYCQILVGVCAGVSALLLMPFREWKVKRILSARKKLLQNNLDNEKENTSDEQEQPDGDYDQIGNEIVRLENMLDNTMHAYLIRMFYPIAV